MKKFNKIVEEVCKEEDIEYKFLSKGWIMQLKKGDKYRYVVGTGNISNRQSVYVIASDKYATYDVLKESGIPVFEHKIIFNPVYRPDSVSDLNGDKEIKEYLNKQKNKKVVVKSNAGYGGKEVFLCDNVLEIKRIIKKIFKRRESVSIMPFYDVDTEYRIIYLKGNIELVYGKNKKENEWKCNLANGAKPEIIEDGNLKNILCDMAYKVGKILDLEFASIDISRLTTGELMIVEVNSSVAMEKFIDYIDERI